MFDPTQFATPASSNVSPSAKFDPTKFASPAIPGVFNPKPVSTSPFNPNTPLDQAATQLRVEAAKNPANNANAVQLPANKDGTAPGETRSVVGNLLGTPNVQSTLGQSATKTVIGSPVKLATSLGEGIDTTVKSTLKNGLDKGVNSSDHTYHIPGLEPFKSFQSEAVDRAKAGQGPVKNIAQGAFDTGLAGLDTVGLVDGAGQVAENLPKISSTISDTAGKVVSNTIGKGAEAADLAKINSKALDSISETISPKITSTETKNIVNQGRLTRGNDSLLFGKQPDIVAQSDAVKNSAQVINNSIPNAAKMSDAELSNAIKSKIGETAQALKPQMEATPVNIKTTGQVQDAWKTLKATQSETPEFLDNQAGNKAFQGKFENYLKQLNWDIQSPTGKFQTPTQKTMQDIWDVRQAYDNSIPANVKNATPTSPAQYQLRKSMWLDNRAILNSAINDTATGLGETSQKAFSDMSSLYDAQHNISSKVKIDTVGKPGPLSKETLKKAGKTFVGGVIVEKALKGLGVPYLP